ncbi:MAG TPA: DUF72 domain-containing protein [Candidatus Binatia bacterium]|nr:DUF72 domain-containing protein [Candidatus Binatia bacterium]
MNQSLLIGTAGYSYPGPPPKGWFGAFYPQVKGKGFDELKYYAQIFNAVEINFTFYRPPSPVVAKGWIDKTPDDFNFAIKLWQKFTHPMKIGRKSAEDQWQPATPDDVDEFRRGLQPLAETGRLGALLLQYPTGFHCTPENMEKVATILQAFYDYPKVVELRHQSWDESSPEIRALLEENRASGVLIDEPKFASSIRQDAVPIGEIFYFRAHGRNAKTWWRPKESWERYDYCYSRDEIKKMAERIKIAASTPGIKKGFAFFNNHARANAPANAIMLSQELGLRLKAMPTEAMLAKFPQLVNVESSSTEQT